MGFAAIRAGFWTAERLAPSLGAAWAERLWFRLPPAPRGRSFTSSGERFELDVDGNRVVGRTWGDGPPVYLMHGWGGLAAQFAAMVDPLVDAGFRVVAFDSLSHGESSPGRHGPRWSTIPEFAQSLNAVIAAHGPAYAVIAHSLGSAAVAISVRDGLAAKRLVFISPAADPMPYTYAFARQLGFGERIRRRMVGRIEARVGVPFSYFDVTAIGRDVSGPPLLVVHDWNDRETRHAEGEAIAAAWPGSIMMTTRGLGHNRILAEPYVAAAVVDFLAEPAPLGVAGRTLAG